MLHFRIAGIACMLLAASGFAIANDTTVPVVVASAMEREMTPESHIAGTVMSRNDTRLAAQVEGRVVWVAEVGTQLPRDEAATRLDDTLIREELAEHEASVARARASVEYNKAELSRLEKLAEKNHAARSRIDEVRRDLAVARSDYTASQARVKQSREKLKRTSIRVPFGGVVTERFIQAGEWADAGTAVIRLVDTASLEVQAWVPVSVLPFVAPGMELRFVANGTEGTGRVRTLVPVGNQQSRLYELRLTLDDPRWSSGQSVRIAIPAAASRTATVVPRDALVLRRDGVSVFRVDENNLAEQVSVTTGIADGDYIEVSGDIMPGDRVIIRGSERLRSGQPVKVLEQQPGM
ncbi:MAG: efflux RND transporter periplasmic adaptor subunit [Gammaproteobacteria bacterium]|nr:MAG: efflux RND transporter periplasmic adaptor subunit [Gammaproteobacteria bacterium]